MSSSVPVNPLARLLRPTSAGHPADVPVADREHAATVVAHLLHEECQQWSWTEHHAAAHRTEARRIVGALCREGWGPLETEVDRSSTITGRPADESGAA